MCNGRAIYLKYMGIVIYKVYIPAVAVETAVATSSVVVSAVFPP